MFRCLLGGIECSLGLLLLMASCTAACLWTAVAEYYFVSVAGGVMVFINGFLVLKLSNTHTSFMQEANLCRAVNLISIPVAVYMLCYHIFNFMTFLGRVMNEDFMHPLSKYTGKDTNVHVSHVTKSPLLAVVILDSVLLACSLLSFVNCIVLSRELQQLVQHTNSTMCPPTGPMTSQRNGFDNPSYVDAAQLDSSHRGIAPTKRLPRIQYIEDSIYL